MCGLYLEGLDEVTRTRRGMLQFLGAAYPSLFPHCLFFYLIYSNMYSIVLYYLWIKSESSIVSLISKGKCLILCYSIVGLKIRTRTGYAVFFEHCTLDL